jgi:hypothetical protein
VGAIKLRSLTQSYFEREAPHWGQGKERAISDSKFDRPRMFGLVVGQIS